MSASTVSLASLPNTRKRPVSKDSRRITTEWVVSEVVAEDGTRTQQIVSLSTSHYGAAGYAGRPNKCYRTILSAATRTFEPGSPFAVTSFGLYSGSSVALGASTPAARYSAKTLLATHEAVEARVLAGEFDHAVAQVLGAHQNSGV